MKSIKRLIHKCTRSLGFEIVPHPPKDHVRARDSICKVLNKLSIDCVIDVGGNHGQYGEWLRDIGYTGWIVSFEPVRAPFEDLSRRAAALPPWRVFQYALGSENGQAEINLNVQDTMSSFLTPVATEALPWSRVASRETVEIRRLDSIWDECLAGIPSRHLYLKLDTQGFDLEVLRGADGILANFLAAQTEVSFVPLYDGMPNRIDSLKEFQNRGFGVVDFMPVLRMVDDLRMMEMDCILARSSEPV
jgi:FkbM family methyltransferase